MAGFEGMVEARPPLRIDEPNYATLGEVARAALRETLVTNPATAYYRQKKLQADYQGDTIVGATDAREELKGLGLEGRLLIPDQGIPRAALDTLIERKQDELKRADVFARAAPGIAATTTRLAVGLGASLLDPINIAAGFFPVVGEARYAQLLGKGAGVLRRTAVRAGVGAVEGTAGAAVVEPLIATSKSLDQADYDMADSIANIAFGGVFGAGLHTVGGALGDLWKYSRGSAGATVANVAPETRAATLKTAVAQAMDGQRVEVEPLVNLDPRSALGDDPFARASTLEQKLEAPFYREQLGILRRETGWLEEGGKVMREGSMQSEGRGLVGEGQGEVIGRTPWLPRADWWPERPHGLSESEVHTAIDKALAGEPLGERQRDTVEFLLDVADQRRALSPFEPTADELAAADLADTMDARMQAALVARASEIDEAAVERLAVQYEDDPESFLRAVREISDREPANEGRAPSAPPLREADYIDERAYKESIKAQYVRDGEVIASSRTTPFSGDLPPLGTWRLDSMRGIHGREVAQLRAVKIDDLAMPELDSAGQLDTVKRPDVETYRKFREEGRRAPPIEVVETDKGKLQVLDGHRRVMAAKAAGVDTIEAWVSPAMDHPEGARDAGTGKVMRVGATLEAERTQAGLPATEVQPAAAGAANAVKLADVRRAAEERRASTAADETAAKDADAQLEEPPVGPQGEPEADLTAAEAELADELARLKESDIDPAELDEYDALIADAETFSKAARAAAVCGWNHA